MCRECRLADIVVGTAEDIDKLARRQVRVTKEHNEECKKLLALMGIPVVTVSRPDFRLFQMRLGCERRGSRADD